MFHLPNGATATESKVEKIHHHVCKPAHTVEMVPFLVNNTLLSASKFTDVDYISIYDGDEVNIYDGHTTRIKVSEKAVLKGWRCPATKLWQIPLRAKVTDVNEDTLVLNSKDGKQSLNYLYEVPTTNHVIGHVQAIMMSDRPSESIHNV